MVSIPDLRQTLEYRELTRSWAVTEELGGGQFGFLLILKLFTFVKILVVQRAHDPAVLSAVDAVARRLRCVLVKVAPNALEGSPEAAAWEAAFAAHGYAPDRSPTGAPTKTLVLDLTPSEDELLAGMKSKTRYNIGLARRKGVATTVVDASALAADPAAMADFYRLYEDNCRRVGFGSMQRELVDLSARAFGERLFAVLARRGDGELAAVGSFVVAGDRATYMINGSTESGRSDFAPTLVLWQGITEARRRGCRWFDFDGIHDERYKSDRGSEGVGRFKQGFGGQELAYARPHRKWWPALTRKPPA